MESRDRFAGMTTNERLYEGGLLEAYEEAELSRNKERMVEILGKVGLASQADWIAETSLNRSRDDVN